MKENKLWGEAADLQLLSPGVVVVQNPFSLPAFLQLKWLIVVKRHLLCKDFTGNKTTYSGLCVRSGKYCVCISYPDSFVSYWLNLRYAWEELEILLEIGGVTGVSKAHVTILDGFSGDFGFYKTERTSHYKVRWRQPIH